MLAYPTFGCEQWRGFAGAAFESTHSLRHLYSNQDHVDILEGAAAYSNTAAETQQQAAETCDLVVHGWVYVDRGWQTAIERCAGGVERFDAGC